MGALLVAAAAAAAQDRVRVKSSAQRRAAVERAAPGRVISLAPGTYAPGLRFVGVAGAKDRPIVIEGGDLRPFSPAERARCIWSTAGTSRSAT